MTSGVLLVLALGGCRDKGPDTATPVADEDRDALRAWCPADADEVAAQVEETLAAMSLEEQAAQLAGDQLAPNERGTWDTPDDTTHGVPGFHMVDGPRGAQDATGPATAFPVGMARGATWAPALEHRVGEAIAAEAQTAGADMLLAPTINVLRHPRWGRAQETYGEDPWHLGALGVAFVQGAQTRLMAQVKHFAVNSIEDTRFDVDVSIDDAALHEVYLPHFRRVVGEGGAAAVMAAYNTVNGARASESAQLMNDILRDQWGYPGITVSDWVLATETTEGAALGGLDVEMPFGKVYGEALLEAVADGVVPEDVVTAAARRVLTTKRCFGLVAIGAEAEAKGERLSEAHLALAQEVAERSLVLLTNDGALPLAGDAAVVVTGRLAEVENIGDDGSSAVEAPDVVTVAEGMVEEAGGRAVTVIPVEELEARSGELAAADAVVVVVGYTGEDEGEGLIAAGDREAMGLRGEDEAAIAAASAVSERVIVVLYGGGAITMPWLADVEAAVMVWYPGARGGTAVARALYGEVNPSGRLPQTFPVEEADLPAFDNVSLEVTYDAFHGYRHLDRTGAAALFPFGHGLSYTTFVVGAPSLEASEVPVDGVIRVTVEVENTGAVEGIETVQLYVGPEVVDESRPARALKAFAQVALAAGERAPVTLEVPASELRVYEGGGWVDRPGEYRLEVSQSAESVWHTATVTIQ